MKFVSKEDEFTLLIGRGLSVFGRLEMSLAELFVAAIRTSDPKTAERVFWSVNSLEVRVAMTRAAIKSTLSDIPRAADLLASWTEIASKLPNLSSKRAELAHGNWVGFHWMGPTGGAKTDQFFAPYYGKASVEVGPHNNDPRYDPRPNKRLYIPDLEARVKEFSEMDVRITLLTSLLYRALHEQDARQGQEAPPRPKAVRPSPTQTKTGTPQPPERAAEKP